MSKVSARAASGLAHHLKGNVVAYIALFMAFSGSAVALQGRNTVDSGDIKNREVKTADIAKGAVSSNRMKPGSVGAAQLAPGAVGPGAMGPGSVDGGNVVDDSLTGADIDESTLDLVAFDHAQGKEGTVGSSDLSGPSVELDVPPGGVIAYYASLRVSSISGDQAWADVAATGPSSLVYSRLATATSAGDYCSSAGFADGSPMISCSPIVLDSTFNHSDQVRTWTVELTYNGVGGEAEFEGRRLWAWVIAPPQ